MEFKTTNRDGYNHVVIKNNKGMIVELSSIGASLYDIFVPNKDNETVSVLLKPTNIEDFKGRYYGKTIGRFAGRIDKAVCEIAGKEYKLEVNWNGVNSLHGGFKGLSCQVCDFTVNEKEDYCEVVFTYFDPSGMLPGDVSYEIIYHIMANTNEIITYHNATTTDETIINMTNHAYFNLSGNCKNTILNHNLYLQCNKYTRLNNDLITLSIDDVTPVMDFRDNHNVGKYVEDESLQNHIAKGYDHCFMKADEKNPLLAILSDNESGIKVTISSDYPSVVFYSGCYPDAIPMNADGIKSVKYQALCLEPQFIPNGVNMENVPQALLKPGEKYSHYIKYSFE